MKKVEVICVWSSYTQKVHSITALTHKNRTTIPIELADCYSFKPKTIHELQEHIHAILKANNFYTNYYESFNSKFYDIYFIDLDDCSHKPSRYGI